MATTKACTDLKYKFYNGGWSSSWSSNLYGGYAGKEDHVVVLKFKTPAVSGKYADTKLALEIPYVRQAKTDKSGTLYVKLHTSDPTSKAVSKVIPTSSDYDASAKWSISDQEVHKAKFTITKTLTSDTTYYLAIGSSSQFMQIGYNSDAGKAYVANFTYTSYTNGTVSNFKITNESLTNPFSTRAGFSGSADCVKAGTNNKLTSATLYYTTNGSAATESSSSVSISVNSDGSFKKIITFTNLTNGAIIKVNAMLKCVFAHNTVKTSATAITIEYKSAGLNPDPPAIKDNNNNKMTLSGNALYTKNGKALEGSNNKLKWSQLWHVLIDSTGKTIKRPTILFYNPAYAYYTSEPPTGMTALETVDGKKGVYSHTYDIPAPTGNANGIYTVETDFANCYELQGDYSDEIGTPGLGYAGAPASTTVTGTVTYHGDIGNPKVAITDNYDNTFTITGTNAADGCNNKATTKFVWGYTTAYGNTGTGTMNLTDKTDLNPKTSEYMVYAKATATSQYLDLTTSGTDQAKIKYYVAPSKPGAPVISYKKNRLTIKEPWTFRWPAAKASNDSSPVKGYRIRLYKNNAVVTGLVSGTNNTLTKDSSKKDYLDRESTSCTVVIDPTTFGFKPGDTVKLGVYAYTRQGKNNDGTQMFNDNVKGNGTDGAQVNSGISVVKNAGIVRVKVGGQWKEGQVYVKVGGSWKEAETVNVKVNGAWKESQ